MFLGTESPLNIWNDETKSEALVEIWRKSTISRELERLLSSQEPTETKRKRVNSDIQGQRGTEKATFQQSSIPRPQNASSKATEYPNPNWSDRTQDFRSQNNLQTPPGISGIDVSECPNRVPDI